MRASQKSSRARGRGGRKPNGSNVNRVYESAGPEGKVRGTPQQIIDKYLTLARDAQTSGDRVVAENFLQHAEHYQRILIEAAGARQERRDNPLGDMDQPDFETPDEADGTRMQTIAPVAPGFQGGDERRSGGRPGNAGGSGDRGDGRNGGQGDARTAREADVGGMTTIDSGEGDVGSLLVDAEDLSASQPRRRRARPGQGMSSSEEAGETPAPADADTQSK
jgi:hypothetical protein